MFIFPGLVLSLFLHHKFVTENLNLVQALEKSKYEQSLESVRRFIAIAEKELELYYRHVALYGDPSDRDPKSVLDHPEAKHGPKTVGLLTAQESLKYLSSSSATGFADEELSDCYLDSEGDDMLSEDFVSSGESSDEASS